MIHTRILFVLVAWLHLLPAFAQVSQRVDSATTATFSELDKNRAKDVDRYQHYFTESGISSRLDSLDYPYVIVRASGRGENFHFVEMYYTHPDSTPALVYENRHWVEQGLLAFYQTYTSLRGKPGDTNSKEEKKTVERRKYRFVQQYRYGGCIRYSRLTIHYRVKNRLKQYEVTTFFDKKISCAKTYVTVPPRFPVFIVRMKYLGRF